VTDRENFTVHFCPKAPTRAAIHEGMSARRLPRLCRQQLSPKAPAVSDRPANRPPDLSNVYAPAWTPTLPSETFTPGPIVELMEIFFI